MIRRTLISLLFALALTLAAGCGSDHPAWTENTVEQCTDDFDNDGDALKDCADPDCAGTFPWLCGGASDTVGGTTSDTVTPTDTTVTVRDTVSPQDTVTPPSSGLCLEVGDDCSSCPSGWDECLVRLADDERICSKSCDSDFDCGACGACYAFDFGARCVNYDWGVDFCPPSWSCAPSFTGCVDIGTSWSASGLDAYFQSANGFETNWLGLGFTEQFDGVDMTIETYVSGDGLPGEGSFNLRAGADGNYGTCTHCVRVGDDCTADGCGRVFFQAGGTGHFEHVATEAGERFSGQLVDLYLVEVAINGETWESTPVPGGACYHVQSLTWDSSTQSVSSNQSQNLGASSGSASAGGN